MSGGKLSMNLDKVREDNLFEKLYRERKNPRPQQGPPNKRHGGGGSRPFKQRFNPHRRRDQ